MTVARSHKGGAKPTTLLGGISPTALSFTVVTGGGSGYPDGSAGVFVVTLDAGTASEEKILCSARASDTFTVPGGGRGYDDTTAVAHVNNASVRHTFSAVEAQEANNHILDSGNPHPQYLPLTVIGASVFRNTAQSIPNGAVTLVAFDTESWDTDGIATLGANNERLTAKRAGVYQITYRHTWAASSTGSRYVALDLNGAGTYFASDRRTAIADSAATISVIQRLALNDYVRTAVYQDSGGALDLTAGYPTMTLTYLGA